MEISKEERAVILMKNAAFMTVAVQRCMLDISLFDLSYGNPANFRVLYHNSLDAYLALPGAPTQDVVNSVKTMLSHGGVVFAENLGKSTESVHLGSIEIINSDA